MTTTRMFADLGEQETQRVFAVRDWFQRQPGWTDRLLAGDSGRARNILDGLLDTDRGRQLMSRATDGVLARLDAQLLTDLDVDVSVPGAGADAAQRTTALARADEAAERSSRRYVAWLSGQGAVAGAASLSLPLAVVAVTADVGSAVLGALRAAGHMLVFYGVPASDPRTVRAAVDLAGVATETDPAVRQEAISSVLSRLTSSGPEGIDAECLPRLVAQQVGSRAVREAIEQTIRRAVRRRAVRAVPLFGAAASGLASGWLARRVTEAGRHVGAVHFIHVHTGLPPEHLLGVEPSVA